ncbi:hypothetical protein JIN84_02095 [Luteolibacter yonseiensis]|uniref:Uncharacterized protein n=1 Tax=Luteolibacter yonseiensis TaxID=1144680 RepID=A0A934V9Q0_9BACT|nr:hypothetical protein [Luteolibacter yonseiensis]MBK1814385.1 hypothetical protein [Luteolibacter yonseiensis]
MRFVTALLACAVAAYGTGFYLAIPKNPEVRFWKNVVDRREAEIATVRKEQPSTPIIFFTGGSSTAFSIDPRIIETTCGLPSFNLGLPVAAGAKYLLHQALANCAAGDTLVICLEPDLLTYSTTERSPSAFSFAMATSAGDPGLAGGGDSFGHTTTFREYLNLSRPGPRYLATLGLKMLSGKEYRYGPEDIKYHGRIETPIHNPDLTASGIARATRLSSEGESILRAFREAADRKGVRLFYSMPWLLTKREALMESRSNKRSLLENIDTIIPVLRDDFSGCEDDVSNFSDTGMHLSGKGSGMRSLSVAESLRIVIAGSSP